MVNNNARDENVSNLRTCFLSSELVTLITDEELPKKKQRVDEKFAMNATLSESIFSLLFSPTTPVCFDSSGILSEFIKSVFAGENFSYELHDQRDTKYHSKKDISDIINDSKESLGNIDGQKNQKDDIILLHDLNIWIPQSEFQSYTLKALKTHWAPLLHKLGCFTINELKDTQNQVNKKIPIGDSGLSIFQTTIFSSTYKFTLGLEYEAKCTLNLVEPDFITYTNVSQNPSIRTTLQLDGWVLGGLTCFMKHFPQLIKNHRGEWINCYTEMMRLQNTEIPRLTNELEGYQCTFENIFCMARSLHDMKTYVQLQSNIRNIKLSKEKLEKAISEYQAIVQSDILLITYAKYLCCLYKAMTIMCKLIEEPVYSWKMYLKIIDSIIAKKKREFSKKGHDYSDEEDDDSKMSNKNLKDYKEKTKEHTVACDFDFLYSAIIPGIYSVMSSGYSSENVALLSLLFALEISLERGNLSSQEHTFFIESLCRLPNYKHWRRSDTSFVRITDKVDKSEFIKLKRSLIRLYPKRRDLFEKIGDNTITYKEMMGIINRYWAKDEQEKPRLIENINLRFICPDDEFRSKI